MARQSGNTAPIAPPAIAVHRTPASGTAARPNVATTTVEASPSSQRRREPSRSASHGISSPPGTVEKPNTATSAPAAPALQPCSWNAAATHVVMP